MATREQEGAARDQGRVAREHKRAIREQRDETGVSGGAKRRDFI